MLTAAALAAFAAALCWALVLRKRLERALDERDSLDERLTLRDGKWGPMD